MALELTDALKALDGVDIFAEAKNEEHLVGHTFYIDYSSANLLVSDAWKQRAGGLPQGSFLLAFYENEPGVDEAMLLRVIEPTTLPTDSEVVGSMIEYYKDNLKTSGSDSKIDNFTRFHFSWSGLKCRILGTFYRDQDGEIQFGADVENFYSANNYSVYKPQGKVLEYLINFRDGSGTAGGQADAKIGKVRYSSSRRFPATEPVTVYVSPTDFLGKRTALFGMTRTGKSNTVKKIIQATTETGDKATQILGNSTETQPYLENGCPSYPVGQIIFDINGEYANENMQDAGTAISAIYKDKTVRYSVLEKPGFKIMKVNFYRELAEGLSMLTGWLQERNANADYVSSFTSISLEKPEDYDQDKGVQTRYDRLSAAYQCVLYKAGYAPPSPTIRFQGAKEINEQIKEGGVDPSQGISWDDAVLWWEWVWENQSNEFFLNYKKKKGRDWADQDLQSTLIMLTGKKTPTTSTPVSGYKKLVPYSKYHTSKSDKPFTTEIVEELRAGKIVIIDLSQGDEEVQQNFSDKICRALFGDSMRRFIDNKPTNFVQMYFEEAHNIFPKKDDKDLSNIYNRLAKEGAKLSLGLLYATQEVSSISSNILKNTQNWFIAHLNNEDEIRELRKYYDFADFADSLVKFSASNDKGFVRMKTYSNAFIVPVQIDKFAAGS
jgi:DNA helicase HerA-like ATPase